MVGRYARLRCHLKRMFDFVPKRYVFTFMGFTATTLSVALQTNLSLAIVYMVDNGDQSSNENSSSTECIVENSNRSLRFNHKTDYGHGDYFDWSPAVQGVVLGALYYGMIFAYIPGGRFAEIYGAKRTIMCSLMLASIFTALLPLAARISVYAFIICRVIIGFGTAPVFPVLFYMIPRWIPLAERSLNASVLFAGYGIGAFASFLTTGILCSSPFFGGWTSVFYFGGLSGAVWCLLFYFMVYEQPENHPTILESEVEYIKKNLDTSERKQIKHIPWKSIATSIPFWTLAIGTFGQFWILGFYVTSQSLYMGTVLHLDSAQNGFLSCLPNLTRAIFACICGAIADCVLAKRKIPIIYIRKGATLLNSVVACLGFVAILFSGCDPVLNTICFIVGGLMGDFLTFGVSLATVDIAPNLAGTLSGTLSCVGDIPYFLLPALIGMFTRYEQSLTQWKYVYYCTIGVIVVTTMVYVAFGTSEPQAWATDDPNSISTSIPNHPKYKKHSSASDLNIPEINATQHI